MSRFFKTKFLKSLPYIIILLSTAFWLSGGIPGRITRFGQLLGIIGYSFFSISLLLSTRIRWMESLFGGLDKVYHLHHRLGTIGFICLIAHPLILSLKWLSQNPYKTLTFLLPVHRRIAVNVGVWAFWVLTIILILTYLKLLPYDKWKILHAFLAAVFILAAFHVFLVPGHTSTALLVYLGFVTAIGLFGAIYRNFLFSSLHKPLSFQVQKIIRRTSRVVEIILSSESDVLTYKSGQFVFVSFKSPKLTTEQHPFTLCMPPASPTKSISVKALGDFTTGLIENLQTGDTALIEGPYGVFNYLPLSKNQVWIAGGIGITPFLCWAREMEACPKAVDLYYCVPFAEESAFMDEFQNLEKRFPNFSIRNICTRSQGHITADQIKKDLGDLSERDIYMCGPIRMTADLKSQFLKMGIPEHQIHFEDFEFV